MFRQNAEILNAEVERIYCDHPNANHFLEVSAGRPARDLGQSRIACQQSIVRYLILGTHLSGRSIRVLIKIEIKQNRILEEYSYSLQRPLHVEVLH